MFLRTVFRNWQIILAVVGVLVALKFLGDVSNIMNAVANLLNAFQHATAWVAVVVLIAGIVVYRHGLKGVEDGVHSALLTTQKLLEPAASTPQTGNNPFKRVSGDAAPVPSQENEAADYARELQEALAAGTDEKRLEALEALKKRQVNKSWWDSPYLNRATNLKMKIAPLRRKVNQQNTMIQRTADGIESLAKGIENTYDGMNPFPPKRAKSLNFARRRRSSSRIRSAERKYKAKRDSLQKKSRTQSKKKSEIMKAYVAAMTNAGANGDKIQAVQNEFMKLVQKNGTMAEPSRSTPRIGKHYAA